ncbi:vomeronasal type-2 receptor 116-like [Ctenodactylus gundi]
MPSSYQNVLALIFATEEINRNPQLLPNISLGYEFHNFLYSHWRVLESFLLLHAGQDETPNYTCGRESKSVAVLTGTAWATAAQIGTFLELYKFPQLTFGSFDPVLRENGQFPSLYQMAPKDTSLARGMVSLMLRFSWTWDCAPNASLAFLPANRFDTATNDGSYNVYNAVYAVALALHEVLLHRMHTQSVGNEEQMMVSPWKIPHSVCTVSCNPGFRKAPQEGRPACCFDCTPCPENEIANHTDMDQCVKCPDHQYANAKQNHCLQKDVTFLAYEDSLGKALAATALSLSVLTILVLGLFVKHRNTPIVKAHNRGLSYTLLVSLTFCFLCSLLFIGRPNTATCVLRQTTFGIAFTVAVSTVLAKTITVVLAFKIAAPNRKVRRLLVSGAPNSIIPICSLIQLTLCGIWMGTSPPFIDTDAHSEHGHVIIVCNKGSLTAFYCVLGYLGSLALGSFTVAFLARNLPDTFNEAKYLTFSMLVFCSVWVTFLPVYHSTQGKAMVAMEVFSILASSAGLLGCIFAPKCYIILLKPDRNSLCHIFVSHVIGSGPNFLRAHEVING